MKTKNFFLIFEQVFHKITDFLSFLLLFIRKIPA